MYECHERQPLMIPCSGQFTRFMVTNGFHHSRMIHIKNKPGFHFYEVESAIDNIQLLTGLMLTLLFFMVYIFSGFIFFMVFANVPLITMFYLLYFKRNDFMRIYELKPELQATKS